MTHDPLPTVLKHAAAFERFAPRSLFLCGLPEPQAQDACERLVQEDKLTRISIMGESWYHLTSQPPPLAVPNNPLINRYHVTSLEAKAAAKFIQGR